MSETRKIAAILVADVVGNSRLAVADEDRTLSRLRGCAAIWLIPRLPHTNPAMCPQGPIGKQKINGRSV